MRRSHILYRFAWIVSVIMHVLLSLYFLRSESYTRGLITFNFIDGYWDLLLHPRGYMAWLLLFNPKSCPMLWSHGPQHARLPCPSLTPGVYPNTCPLSQWCHLTISSSVVPFSSCLQSFPASGSFPTSQFFTSGSQNIGVSASTLVLPMNTQDWSPLGWTGWISLQSKGLSRVFSNTTVQKHQFFGAQLSLWSNSHIHTWPLEKP